MRYNWHKSDNWWEHVWSDKPHNRDKFFAYRDRPDYYNFLYKNKQCKYYNHKGDKAGYYYRDSNKFYKFYQYINGNGQNKYYEDTFWQWCHTRRKWVVWQYDDLTSV